MSSSGQANEAGSVFRRDAATYFAVHAVAEISIASINERLKVLRIDFETIYPTDDIVLSLTEGVKAFVSAKRKVNAGLPFLETVEGWVGQLHAGVGASDLLVLAYAESAKWVEDLADALRRLRNGQNVVRSAEKSALKKLDDLVPEPLQIECHQRVRLVRIALSSTNADPDEVLKVLLERVVDGNAHAALNSLRSGLHTLAGSALGADVSHLLAMMTRQDDVAVRQDKQALASRELQKSEALREFVESMQSRSGRVDLPLLANDLLPVYVDDLIDSVSVTDTRRSVARNSDDKIYPLLRRLRRILLVGQPGSGKSATLWEIASACTRDPDAPLPIRIYLPDLIPIMASRDPTISDLIGLGAQAVKIELQQALEELFASACQSGDAIILADGLDECRELCAQVADHLRRMIKDCDPGLGIVIATRPNATVAAERLGLVRLNLTRPSDLDTTLDAVLSQCAETRVDPEHREQWLQSRRRWLDEVRGAQAGLVEVPQLALLLVLIVAETSDLDVPGERAELLHRAVKRSVERWEWTRFKNSSLDWAVDLTPGMLLDGFMTLGLLLELGQNINAVDARLRLMEMLGDQRWGIRGGKAEGLAEQIIAFWNEHVGVFTIGPSGEMNARSRVFAEVATAMWTKERDEPELRDWLEETLRSGSREGALTLAQGLNENVVSILFDMGEVDVRASLALVAASGNRAAKMEDDYWARLASQLGRHLLTVDAGVLELIGERHAWGRATRSLKRDNGFVIDLIDALCTAELTSQDTMDGRRAVIRQLKLTGNDKQSCLACISLNEAVVEGRDLQSEELALVQALIDLPLPDTHFSETSTRPRRRRIELPDAPMTPVCFGSVLRLAINFLRQLDEGSAEKIFRCSRWVPGIEYFPIVAALRAAGFSTDSWEDGPSLKSIARAMQGAGEEVKFLQDISSLYRSAGPEPLSKADRWSLSELADLLFVSGYLSAAVSNFRAAFANDSPSLRRGWLAALGASHEIDIPTASAQARLLIDKLPSDVSRSLDWWTLLCRPYAEPSYSGLRRLTQSHQDALLSAAQAHSDWVAWNAANILIRVEPAWDVDAYFDADWSSWKPRRALLYPLVAILASSHAGVLVQRAANSSDPVYRQAAVRAVRISSDLDEGGQIAAKLSVDPDLTVRGDWDTGVPKGEYWSCNDCAYVNNVEAMDCGACQTGIKPARKRA